MTYVVLALLLMAGTAYASVEVEIKTWPEPTACRQPDPEWVKNRDGSYTYVYPQNTYAVACFSGGTCSVQEWTSPPTSGGRFIQHLRSCPAPTLMDRIKDSQ
jgi:hypothetical protein